MIRRAFGAVALALLSASVLAQKLSNNPSASWSGSRRGRVRCAARAIAHGSHETLASMVVDNRPGAGTTIASEFIRRSLRRTAHALLLRRHDACDQRQPYTKLPYDSVKDFAFISLVPRRRCCWCQSCTSGQDGARADRAGEIPAGQLNYASSGNGTIVHLAVNVQKHAGIDLLHVPYKGSAPATVQ